MKRGDIIIAVVLAVLGLGIIAYGVLDAVYFGIEALSLICLIGGAAAIALAAVLVFIKDEPKERQRKHEPVRESFKAPADLPPRHAVYRSGFVLAAAILSALCTILAVLRSKGLFSLYSTFPMSNLEAAIMRSSYMQVVWGTVASVCLFFGYFKSLKWAVLVGSICECIAAVVFILWLLFHVLPIIFAFVGYARMKKVSDFDTGET